MQQVQRLKAYSLSIFSKSAQVEQLPKIISIHSNIDPTLSSIGKYSTYRDVQLGEILAGLTGFLNSEDKSL